MAVATGKPATFTSTSSPSSSSSYLVTATICLVAFFVLFGAILPRIPRLLLRGRLRVKCVGLTGLSGIEWRSNGFGKSPSDQGGPQGAAQSPECLVVKVQRIYLAFGRTKLDDTPKSKQGRTRSWLTINVQGVGVRLPRSPTDEASQQRKLEHAKVKAAEEEEAAKKLQDEEDKRIEALVRGDSPPAPKAGTEENETKRREHTSSEAPSPWLESSYYWLSLRAYPAIRSQLFQAARAMLFCIVSSLPALMSFIGLEIHRVEVYMQEVESVVRVEEAGVELAMALVTDREHAGAVGRDRRDAGKAGEPRHHYRRLSEAIINAGYSARGAATSITAGLPAGRGSLTIRVSGVEVFEADLQSDGKADSQSSRSSARRSSQDSSLSSSTIRFTSDTGWAKDRQIANAAIPVASKLFCLPEVTRFEIGLRIGTSLSFGGRETVETSLDLSKVDVGLDALYRIVRIVEDRKALRTGPMPTVAGAGGDRSAFSRHFAQQRREPAEKALASLRSLSVTMPQISFRSDTRPGASEFSMESLSEEERKRLPSAIYVGGNIKGIHVSLKNSDPSDRKHQYWLGTCGTHNHKPMEHRRAFLVDAGFSSLQLSCRVDKQKERSEFVHLDDFNVHLRSTWTPFGLFPASLDGKEACRRFFQGDPNEQALFAEISLDRIRGDVKLDCAAALLTYVEMRRAERRAVMKRLKIDRPSRETKFDSILHHVPRLSIGLEVGETAYRLDAGRALSSDSTQDASLMLKVPSFNAAFHGSYRDAYIRRSDRERAAAWKALEKDELEWSLKSTYRSEGPGASSPRVPSSGFSAFVGKLRGGSWSPTQRSRAASKTEERGKDVPSPNADAGGMSIEEAVSKMNEIIKTESEEKRVATERQKSKDDSRLGAQDREIILPGTADGKPGEPQVVKIPARLVRRPSLSLNEDCGIVYDFESNFTCPVIESFFVFTGHYDDHKSPEDGGDGAQFVRRQLLAINNVDASAIGDVPGIQELGTSRPIMRLSGHHTKLRGFVEEIDLELWHPRVFEVIQATVREIQIARRPFVTSAAREEYHEPGELGHQPSAFAQTAKVVHLIDKFRHGLDLWLSIGGILAHVGGNDMKCDPHLCRGVGFEARRIVIEFVCQKKAPELLLTKADWGARSALMLPEDLVMSANALALRHGKAATGKISLYEIGLFPLLDVEDATLLVNEDLKSRYGSPGRTRKQTSPSDEDGADDEEKEEATAIFADAIWDFHDRQPAFETSARRRFNQEDRAKNYIFWMPYSATRVTIRPPGIKPTLVAKHCDELTIESDGTRLLSFRIQLLHSYCILIAVAALRRLKPDKAEATRDGDDPAKDQQPEAPPSSKLARPSVLVDLGVADVHIFVDLPDNVNLFLHLRRLDLRWTDAEGGSILWESLMGAVESPRVIASGQWEEMVRLRDWKVSVNPSGGPDGKLKVYVNGDGASVRIPYGYVVHHIIDSTSVAFKATKQLVHQFVKGGEDSIIIPVGEDPKHLPYVDVNIRILTIEAQDDPIETRLNIIWRAGGDENRMRLEREEAFAAKLAKLEAEKKLRSASRSSVSLRSSRGTSKSRPRSKSIHSQSSRSGDESDDTSGSETETSQSDIDIEEHIQQARSKLDAYNSSSWLRRYANARAEQGKREDAMVKSIFGRFAAKAAVELPIEMVQPSRASPLFRSSMSKVKLAIGPTSFPEDHLRDWMHQQGNGTPKDLTYSLLVPLHLRWTMAEWRWELRDYPIPLLHIPPVKADQGEHIPAFELSGDFCIAEHISEGNQSIRHVPAIIVPAATGHPDASEFGINVPKVAMPVKFYGSPVVDINSAYPTRFAWGQSLQPAIADMVRVFDGISSPPPDPSPKLGFWDKLPLIIQSRIHLRWKNKGELHLYLKGSRDPYSITGNGAGWVKCWRGDVEVRIGFENPDGEFLQFLSDQYILAIPDLRDYHDKAAMGTSDKSAANDQQSGKDGGKDDDSNPPKSNALSEEAKDMADGKRSLATEQSRRYMKEPNFSKICIKLTNGVRWGASLRHEHTCRDQSCKQDKKCSGENFYRACRFFERRPHWTVIQRSKEYVATLPEDERHGDSFYGWRSDFAHLALSIYSPNNGLVVDGVRRGHSGGSNNLYFSPLAWQHFWAWLRLFDSSMGLPIRQGRLFPAGPPPSPKFGRSLGTIKYRFDISPLYISHLYHQHSRSDWAKGLNTILGIKARLSSFHVDMHQRQQETIKERPELKEAKKVFHKPFYEAEADLSDIDLRALVGRFRDSSKRLVDYASADVEADEDTNLLDEGSVVGPEDLEWVDLNDFVEVDYTPNDDEPPEIRLIQTLTCPRFNFYRRFHTQSERREMNQGKEDEPAPDITEESKFGNEDPETHTCLIGKAPLNFHVQAELARARISVLKDELDKLDHTRRRNADVVNDLRKRIKLIEDYCKALQKGDAFEIKSMRRGPRWDRSQDEADDASPRAQKDDHRNSDARMMNSSTSADGAADLSEVFKDLDTFDDRFFVHNPVIVFSNQVRHVLLRYYAMYKKRKGFVHHMTARAIYNIKQLSKHLENDGKGSAKKASATSDGGESRPEHSQGDVNGSKSGIELLSGLLNDTQRYVLEDSARPRAGSTATSHQGTLANAVLDTHVNPWEGISEAFDVHRSNFCVFLKPQIVMKSQIDESSTVILTAIRTRLQNFAVVDPSISDEDSVNRRVLSRNYFSMDGLQAFHPIAHNDTSISKFSNSRQAVGTQLAVPLETLIDLRHETGAFNRIVSRTDASVRYDKFNRLRLHDSTRPITSDACNEDPGLDHLRHYMDLLRVRCPRFAVSANSTHFGALYNIVTDLILYRAPSWQERAKQLQTMLFSYDFKDTSMLAGLVTDLQCRIRRALELDAEYQFHFDDLNEDGKADLFRLKTELSDLVEELLLIADAITESEDAKGEEDKDKKSALRLEAHAQDISWNMMGEREGDLLAKLSIKGPSFTWLNKADNSTANTLSIIDLQAVDVRPDAHFPEIITKWNKAADHPMAIQGRFVNAVWSEMAPVGGISLVDQFEFDVHPLHLQLEIKTGRLIMAYIFGSKRHRQEEEEKKKKLLEAQADKLSSAAQKKRSPFARLTGGRQSGDLSRNSTEAPTPTDEPSSRRTSMSSSNADQQSVFRSKAVSQSASAEGRLSVAESKKSDRNERSNASVAANGNESGASDDEEDLSQFAIAKRNAEEMRHRASSNLTFLLFKLPETVFCLSYKGEKEKSITDVYDLVFKAPTIEYRNRTWTYEDLVQHIKKDVFRAAWGQRTTIVKSILSHRPKRPEALRNIREKQMLLLKGSKETRSVSPLQLHVQPPTPKTTSPLLGNGEGWSLGQAATNNRTPDSEDSGAELVTRIGSNALFSGGERGGSENNSPTDERNELRPLHSDDAGDLATTEGSARSAPVKFGRFLQTRLNRDRSRDGNGGSGSSTATGSGRRNVLRSNSRSPSITPAGKVAQSPMDETPPLESVQSRESTSRPSPRRTMSGNAESRGNSASRDPR